MDIVEVVKEHNELTELKKDYDTLYKNYLEVKDQLALTTKALELACTELSKVEVFDAEFMECDSFCDYFKIKAKEIISNDKFK